MPWARWRNTTQFKEVKHQGDADNGMATVKFWDGTHEEVYVNALLWTSPQYKKGSIVMIAGDLTRQYGKILDSYLEMDLDDDDKHPFFTYVVDWGNWTLGDDNWEIDTWGGAKFTATDLPRQKYLVG